MIINTSQIETALQNRAVPASILARETGLPESSISRYRNGKRPLENWTLESLKKVQSWIDNGGFTFSYDYDELIEEIKADEEEGLLDKTIWVVRGKFNEVLAMHPIIDYYYTKAEAEETMADAHEMEVADVLQEMEEYNRIF